MISEGNVSIFIWSLTVVRQSLSGSRIAQVNSGPRMSRIRPVLQTYNKCASWKYEDVEDARLLACVSWSSSDL